VNFRFWHYPNRLLMARQGREQTVDQRLADDRNRRRTGVAAADVLASQAKQGWIAFPIRVR
jgi:hypothetical protein